MTVQDRADGGKSIGLEPRAWIALLAIVVGLVVVLVGGIVTLRSEIAETRATAKAENNETNRRLERIERLIDRATPFAREKP